MTSVDLDEKTIDGNLSALAGAPPKRPSAAAPEFEAAPERLIRLDSITALSNPRTSYDSASIKDLAASIRSVGLIQAVGVRPGPQHGTYELIYGSRRLRALQHLAKSFPSEPQWQSIRASVHSNIDPRRLRVVQFVENLQRRDLSLLEQALFLVQMRDGENMSTEEIAAQIGFTERHVQKMLAIGGAPEWLRAMADTIEVSEPERGEDGEIVLVEGRPQQRTERVPGFGYSDMSELISFHKKLDAWDRKQQDVNTKHRPKAEPETTRVAKKAAAARVTGARFAALLKKRLEEVTGSAVTAPNEKQQQERKRYDITAKRLLIEADVTKLSATELESLKPIINDFLIKLGFVSTGLRTM